MSAALSIAIADLLEASARVIRAAASVDLPEITETPSPCHSTEHVTRNLGTDGSDSQAGEGPADADAAGGTSGGSEQESADDEPARMSGDRIEASGGEGSNPLPETPAAPEETQDKEADCFDPLVSEDAANEWLGSIEPIPMLKDPEPEPEALPAPEPEPEAPAAPVETKKGRPTKELEPKPAPIDLGGTLYHFPANVAPLIRALAERPMSLRMICDAGICHTIHTAHLRIAAARTVLKAMIGDRFKIDLPKDGEHFELKDTSLMNTIRPPEPQPASVAPLAKPAPAAPPQPIIQPVPQVNAGTMKIEPDDLLAVDIKALIVLTPKGSYKAGGSPIARALDYMKRGDLYGLDTIAKVAKWRDAATARESLLFEKKRLAEFGIDLFVDKFNARLRRPGQ